MSKNFKIITLVLIVILTFVFLYKTGTLYAPEFTNKDSSLPESPQVPNKNPPLKDGGKQVACTMDAKMCADGSYVSRTGPNCEFAQCPAYMPPINGAPTHELNQTYEYNGVKITPLKIRVLLMPTSYPG